MRQGEAGVGVRCCCCFLLNKDSVLRGVMAYLAGAGVFWNAWVFDRSARAFVEIKAITADTFVDIVTTRATAAGAGEQANEYGGIPV